MCCFLIEVPDVFNIEYDKIDCFRLGLYCCVCVLTFSPLHCSFIDYLTLNPHNSINKLS